MASPTRVFFIGIDAADKDLLLQWSEAGLLPAIRSLLNGGLWGVTDNPPCQYAGAIWPSFYTGVSPARHGRYFNMQVKPGSYAIERFHPEDIKHEPFWTAISDAGRKVAVIDVPKAPLREDFNGVQLLDWGAHDPEYPFVRAWPAWLAAEAETLFGRDPVGACDDAPHDAAGLTALRDRLIERIETKARLVAHYLNKGGWDLFIAVFAESHCAGHQFWHLHDPGHPRHDPMLARAIGEPIKDVYVALDAAVGRLLEQTGPDTTVVLLASHGMGPHYDGTFLLDEMVRRIQRDAHVGGPTAFSLLRRMWRRIPRDVRRRFKPVADRVRQTTLPADLGRSKCFAVPTNDNCGGIRINLVGREPQGCVRPGPEYDALCDALTEDLRAIVNLETGEPLVREVVRSADLFRGDRLDELPDLNVEWNTDAPVRSIASPKIGRIDREFSGRRTGDHKPHGLFLARGPAIAPGRLTERVSVMDFAPTLAALVGVELPDVDGSPISAVCAAHRRLRDAGSRRAGESASS